jgi:xanthine dehydrogenase accessory factor
VASERKAGVLRESLVSAGEEPARVAAIVSPAGEPIGAQTPEEIALAVLATVVAARRGRPVGATATATASEAATKPAPKFKLDLPPVAMGSCCGGGAAKTADAESVPEAAAPVVAVKSCCGN